MTKKKKKSEIVILSVSETDTQEIDLIPGNDQTTEEIEAAEMDDMPRKQVYQCEYEDCDKTIEIFVTPEESVAALHDEGWCCIETEVDGYEPIRKWFCGESCLDKDQEPDDPESEEAADPIDEILDEILAEPENPEPKAESPVTEIAPPDPIKKTSGYDPSVYQSHCEAISDAMCRRQELLEVVGSCEKELKDARKELSDHDAELMKLLRMGRASARI